MDDSKYRFTISEADKVYKIELEDDGAMVVIKTPDRVIQTAFCNILRWIQEGSRNEKNTFVVKISD